MLDRGTFTIGDSYLGSGLQGHLPDTFASVRGWGKGLAWINGFNLGWCARRVPACLKVQYAHSQKRQAMLVGPPKRHPLCLP